MKKVIASFARNTVFANILLILIFLAGGFAVKNMVRENFPEFELDMITITVPFPGADPEEVEEGINSKLEEAVEGVEGIKLLTTYSSENSGTALIEVRETYDGDKVLDRVRTKVEAISTFPADAEKPIITDLIHKDAVVFLYLSGNMSERRIKEWSERIKDEIQQLPGISQVDVFGAREYEIAIEVSEQRLREYGLSFAAVADAVRRSNLNLAGGTIRTVGEEIRVRTVGRKYTGEELASIVVLADPDGEIITLDRIAGIKDGFTEDPIQAIVNGEQAVLIIVNKTTEEDSLAISDLTQKFVKKKQGELPRGITIDILYDNTEMLRARINLLIKNGIIGLSIVFLLLWIFLNARLSFWSGMGIPISLAGAMAILWGMGATINLISLFGLIMVLGIVVDDAIVVGEAIYVHRKMGKPPVKAAVDGISEVGLPVIAAVITTIVAFIPLAHVGGIMGKFISILPAVVIACLAVSLVECLILLPAHLSTLPDPNRRSGRGNILTSRLEFLHRMTSSGLEWFVERVYKPFLSKALNWRYVSLCTAIAVLLITIGLVNSGIVKFEVMPEIDGFVMTATAEFPDGTPPEVTRQAVDQIDNALLRLAEKTKTISGDPLIKDRLAMVGQTLGTIPDFGPNYGALQVFMLESEKRGIHSKDLMVQWEKEIGLISGIKSLTFEGIAAGPPGAPIEVWIQGYDMNDILAASQDLMKRLRQFEGVYQVRSDFSPGKNEIRLSLKPEARTLGLTVDDLARQVYTGYYGMEALSLQRGRDDIKVKVRYTADERTRISDFEKIRIRTHNGQEIPLTSVADLEFTTGYSTIIRTNGMRRVAVSAGVDTNKANANEIVTELNAGYFAELIDRYPGLIISLQGEQKKMRESFGSLYIGFPMAIIGIFIIIATMFRSYLQPFVILFTVPFGIIGAVMGHLAMGFDLSMMSIFGMVALTGVVVNDAIVLIERVNENIAEGMPFFDAIINGGARRFRAITLTSLSTIGGLMPLILEKDLQARFLIPMALSLAAGVAFATILTLVLIPSLLTILSDFRLLASRYRTGVWPKRTDVEPARDRHKDPMAMNKKQIALFTTILLSTCFLLTGPAIAGDSGSIKTDADSIDWDGIRVLDLKTAEKIALAGNPSIAAAEARLKQAEEQVKQAGSAYWPRLDANAGASRVWLSENEYQTNLVYAQLFNPMATIDDPSDHYRADLTASWLLFNGFARSLSKKSAQYGMDQLEQSREDIKRQLVLSVATAYLSAQQALENMAIARSDEQFFRDRHKEAQIRRQIGTGSLSDELSFEVSFNAAISSRIKAERLYEAALYSLAALLGLENATLPAHVALAELKPESTREMGHPDPENLIVYAYENRPDIIQQEIAVENAEVSVKIAKSGYYPTISLVGSVAGTRDEDYYFEGDDFGNSVGINLTYNLFAGGIDRAKTREARQKEVESQKTLEKTRLEVAADIRSSVADLRASQEQLLLLRSNTELIRQNRDLAEQEYNAGQGSLVRLNEAQRDLTAAKSSLAFALVSMRQSWYALEAKTGRILDYFK